MGNKGRGEKTKMNKGRREGQGERANNNKEFSYVFVWCLFRSLIGPKSGQNPKKKKTSKFAASLYFFLINNNNKKTNLVFSFGFFFFFFLVLDGVFDCSNSILFIFFLFFFFFLFK